MPWAESYFDTGEIIATFDTLDACQAAARVQNALTHRTIACNPVGVTAATYPPVNPVTPGSPPAPVSIGGCVSCQPTGVAPVAPTTTPGVVTSGPKATGRFPWWVWV